jgi:hypothetical protein
MVWKFKNSDIKNYSEIPPVPASPAEVIVFVIRGFLSRREAYDCSTLESTRAMT